MLVSGHGTGQSPEMDKTLEMAKVVQGERAITFLLRDTPAGQAGDGFLDPVVVKNIALVL
jgi:hypothetical protein